MNVSKSAPTPIDVDHLTAEQVAQLRYVLGVLSLHQLVHLAHHIKNVTAEPGFGRITIVVENHHLSKLEAGHSESFAPQLDDYEVQDLME